MSQGLEFLKLSHVCRLIALLASRPKSIVFMEVVAEKVVCLYGRNGQNRMSCSRVQNQGGHSTCRFWVDSESRIDHRIDPGIGSESTTVTPTNVKSDKMCGIRVHPETVAMIPLPIVPPKLRRKYADLQGIPTLAASSDPLAIHTLEVRVDFEISGRDFI